MLVSNEDEPGALPEEVALNQNYPNPFNSRTLIQFVLPEEEQVTLTIYDTRGKMVRQLFDGTGRTGLNTIHWDGKNANGQDLASGVYLYRLEAGNFVETKKMVFLK